MLLLWLVGRKCEGMESAGGGATVYDLTAPA